MGLSDFFKRKKEDSQESDKGNVPLPPQKPSDGNPDTPFSNPKKIPPPSKPDSDKPKLPPPKKGGGMPELPAAPKQPGQGMPPPPAATGRGAETEKKDILKTPDMPEMPEAPDFPDKESMAEQQDIATPAPPRESEIMSMPSAPDDLDLPGFEEQEIDALEELEKKDKIDWTSSPREPELEESDFDTVVEEVQEKQEPIQEQEPEPEQVQKQPIVREYKGHLFVKAEYYQDLFDAIKSMRESVGEMESAVNNYHGMSGKQEHHFDAMAGMLNEVQEKIMEVDTKLFEER